jgi:hypothetical protein
MTDMAAQIATTRRFYTHCPFCGVRFNSVEPWGSGVAYFFECGNAYATPEKVWVDICVSQPRLPQ